MAVSKASLFVLVVALVMFVLAAFDGTKAQAQALGLLAMKLPYDAESKKWWDMSDTSCAAWRAKNLPESLDGLVAFCSFPDSKPACGSCLQVRNPRVRGVTAEARVVALQCDDWEGGLELGISVFKAIDSNGDVDDGGYSLFVDYEFTGCRD